MEYSEEIVEIELNPRERQLYDRVRAVIVAPDPRAPSGLRDILLLLPDLVVLLSRLMRDARVPPFAKLIAFAGVAYVLSPIDFLPVVFLGPIGLIDDLFVVATALSRLMNRVHPDIVRQHWPGKGDALEAVQRLTRWSEGHVVGRLRDLRNWGPFSRRA